MHRSLTFVSVSILSSALVCLVSSSRADDAYKVVNSAKVGGEGGFDYVQADADGRRLYIPRSGGANSRVTVFDLDTLKSAGEIPNTQGVHGVAVDSTSAHGFTSSKPVIMFDTKTLNT